MQYLIISASHRPNSQSEKVSNWLAHQLRERGADAHIFSLADNPIPFWGQDAWDGDSELTAQLNPIREQIRAADGLVFVVPEWAGMAPAGLKNLLLFMSEKTLGHKPIMLVGVSASRGGVYPLAELRQGAFKNTKALFIPDQLLIQDCENVMNDMTKNAEEKADSYIRERALFALGTLEAYAEKLSGIRDDERMWNDKFKYGV